MVGFRVAKYLANAGVGYEILRHKAASLSKLCEVWPPVPTDVLDAESMADQVASAVSHLGSFQGQVRGKIVDKNALPYL